MSIGYPDLLELFAIDTDELQAELNKDSFTSYYFSLYDSLLLQIGNKQIRENIKWKRFRKSEDHCIYKRALILKICRDGFAFQNHRINLLTTATIANLEHGELSKRTTDILQITDATENHLNLYRHSQRISKEVWMLRLCGLFDIVTGRIIGVVCFFSEDSKSTEAALGCDTAASARRFMFHTFPREEVMRWERHHVCDLYNFSITYKDLC